PPRGGSAWPAPPRAPRGTRARRRRPDRLPPAAARRAWSLAGPALGLGGLGERPGQLHHGTHLDGAVVDVGHPRGMPEFRVEIRAVDQVVAGQVLLRLDEGAVDDLRLAV